MKKINPTFYWPPRIFAILFILINFFLNVDAFSQGADFLETLAMFLVHNKAAFFLIAVLAIAWEWEKIGGVLFVIIGFWFIMMTQGKTSIGVTALMTAIPITIGILFILEGFINSKHGKKS